MLSGPQLRKILAAKDDYLFVPMGSNCAVANFLRSAGMRTTAFPFDWNITPIQSAIALLDNRFEGFFDRSTIAFLPETPRKLFLENGNNLLKLNQLITPAYCLRYGILFPHDLVNDSPAEFEKIHAKYHRRIQSLLNFVQTSSRLIFVVTDEPLSEWQHGQITLAGGEFPQRPFDWEQQLRKALAKRGLSGEAAICDLPKLVKAKKDIQHEDK